jgi:hypothetical protein
MSTFLLEQTILMGKVIIRFYEVFSHCDLYPYEFLHSFALGTVIVIKCGNVGFICNVVCNLDYLAKFNGNFSLEQLIIIRTVIFCRFKLIPHHDLNRHASLQSFTLGNEILYKYG